MITKNITVDYEQRIKKLKEYKYLELKAQYDLLIHKRFARSAEQIPADDKQILLFTGEGREAGGTEEPQAETVTTVKSYQRKKAGRKPFSANLTREVKVIDIPESEKIYACRARLTQIGEKISKLKLLKIGYPPPKVVALRRFYGYATAISPRKYFQA